MCKVSRYSLVANEYYDYIRHPTCAHFRSVSVRYLRDILERRSGHFDKVLEVGAGRSVVAELRKTGHLKTSHLEISDLEESMLTASDDLMEYIESAYTCDARDQSAALEKHDQFDLVVASLADPYDDAEFWAFMRTVLRDRGEFIVTTPSFEWAMSFRPSEPGAMLEAARFETINGQVWLPSLIRTTDEERRLAEPYGFKFLDVSGLKALGPEEAEVAPKLAPASVNGLPVCVGYWGFIEKGEPEL